MSLFRKNSSDDEKLKFEDLKQSLMDKDSQLLKVRSKNENILRQYKDAQEELEQCHDQIARQASLIHEQNYKLEECNRRITELTQANSNLLQKTQINVSSFQNEIDQREHEMRKMHETILSKEERIKLLYEAMEAEKEKNAEMEEEIKYKDELVSSLKHKNHQHEAKIDELMMSQKSDSTHIIELEQLRQDKEKLISLLRATKEYKEFIDFNDDSGGNVRYLKDEEPPKKKRGTGAKQNVVSPDNKRNLEIEKDEWVPEEAYRLAHDVRFQTSGEITPKLMNKLLISLNKIWRTREKQTEQRIKKQYKGEIDQLKREKTMKGQYDSVQAKQSLARTRAQLKKAEEKLKEYSQKLTKIKNLPAGMNVIDEALMIGECFSVIFSFCYPRRKERNN
jgi:hypothetical protein